MFPELEWTFKEWGTKGNKSYWDSKKPSSFFFFLFSLFTVWSTSVPAAYGTEARQWFRATVCSGMGHYERPRGDEPAINPNPCVEAMFLICFFDMIRLPFGRRFSSEISKQHNPLAKCCLGLLLWGIFSYHPKVVYSPPDGSHGRNSNWWGLCLMKTTNCCL